MSFSSFIKKYNIKRDFILFTLIVFAVCYLYTDSFYKAKKTLLATKQTAVMTLRSEIDTLSRAGGDLAEKQARLSELKKRHGALENELNALFDRFPSRAEASKMLKDVLTEDRFAGLKLESFYPSGEIATSQGYQYIPIQLKVTGGFSTIGDYIKYMENLPRILIIEDIDFKASEEEDVLNSCVAELKGKTFLLRF